jgi:hypothetical protein
MRKCANCNHSSKIVDDGYGATYYCDAEVYDIDNLTCFVPKDLVGTVEMMQSDDYKERFRAEYYQTKMRYDKLHRMTIKYEAGTLDFTPNCPLDLLKQQKKAMGEYLHALEVRADIEGVKL